VSNKGGNSVPFWKEQYKICADALRQEADRFWTRFNSSLLLNGGLLVTLGLVYQLFLAGFHAVALVSGSAIIILGIVLSAIWYTLTKSGGAWLDYWSNHGVTLENTHKDEVEVSFFGDLKKYESNHVIRDQATKIPILFLATWIVILAGAIVQILISFFGIDFSVFWLGLQM